MDRKRLREYEHYYNSVDPYKRPRGIYDHHDARFIPEPSYPLDDGLRNWGGPYRMDRPPAGMRENVYSEGDPRYGSRSQYPPPAPYRGGVPDRLPYDRINHVDVFTERLDIGRPLRRNREWPDSVGSCGLHREPSRDKNGVGPNCFVAGDSRESRATRELRSTAPVASALSLRPNTTPSPGTGSGLTGDTSAVGSSAVGLPDRVHPLARAATIANGVKKLPQSLSSPGEQSARSETAAAVSDAAKESSSEQRLILSPAPCQAHQLQNKPCETNNASGNSGNVFSQVTSSSSALVTQGKEVQRSDVIEAVDASEKKPIKPLSDFGIIEQCKLEVSRLELFTSLRLLRLGIRDPSRLVGREMFKLSVMVKTDSFSSPTKAAATSAAVMPPPASATTSMKSADPVTKSTLSSQPPAPLLSTPMQVVPRPPPPRQPASIIATPAPSAGVSLALVEPDSQDVEMEIDDEGVSAYGSANGPNLSSGAGAGSAHVSGDRASLGGGGCNDHGSGSSSGYRGWPQGSSDSGGSSGRHKAVSPHFPAPPRTPVAGGGSLVDRVDRSGDRSGLQSGYISGPGGRYGSRPSPDAWPHQPHIEDRGRPVEAGGGGTGLAGVYYSFPPHNRPLGSEGGVYRPALVGSGGGRDYYARDRDREPSPAWPHVSYDPRGLDPYYGSIPPPPPPRHGGGKGNGFPFNDAALLGGPPGAGRPFHHRPKR